MIVVKDGRKGTVRVTSDNFSLVREMLQDAATAGRIANSGRYFAFNSDSPSGNYESAQIAVDLNSKQSLANVLFAFKIWKEGIKEINDFMENKAKNPNIKYIATVYGKTQGEIQDE
jgi:hypothetical protein